MFKIIGGVVLGYIAMFVLVFFTFSGLFLVLGADGAFKPGSYDVTPLWLVVSFVLSLIAAIVGGKVCALVAGRSAGVRALAVLVLILGVLSAIPVLRANEASPAGRTGNVSNTQAMLNAKEPAWFALVLPVIGVVGVLIGGRTKRTT